MKKKKQPPDTQNQAAQWYGNLKTISSLTTSDAEELKSHLLDSMDELKTAGLNESESFEVAAYRLGQSYNYEKEYEKINSDTLLFRKITLVLSGILMYCFFYFLMVASGRFMYYNLYKENVGPLQNSRFAWLYFLLFHLLVLVLTLTVFKWNHAFFKNIGAHKIRPIHILLLIFLVFSFYFTNLRLQGLIKTLPRQYIMSSYYSPIFDYVSYSFALSVSVCFLLLLRTFNSSIKKTVKEQTLEQGNSTSEHQELLKIKFSHFLQKMKDAGLDEEEAIAVVTSHHLIVPRNEHKPVKLILITLSGVLVYLFLYFFMHLTGKMLLSVLQQFENDPVKNFGWYRWYIVAFNLLLIFFTISIYLRDKDLYGILKSLKLKHFYLIFFATIFLGVGDLLFFAISRKSLGNLFELKQEFNENLQFSNLTLSIVLSLCFFIIFTKYYQKHINTCKGYPVSRIF